MLDWVIDVSKMTSAEASLFQVTPHAGSLEHKQIHQQVLQTWVFLCWVAAASPVVGCDSVCGDVGVDSSCGGRDERADDVHMVLAE